MAHNVCVYAVAGIGGLSNGAKRNAKADQLRPVPRHNVNKETESNEDTEPRHCRNILLAAAQLLIYDDHFVGNALLTNQHRSHH